MLVATGGRAGTLGNQVMILLNIPLYLRQIDANVLYEGKRRKSFNDNAFHYRPAWHRAVRPRAGVDW